MDCDLNLNSLWESGERERESLMTITFVTLGSGDAAALRVFGNVLNVLQW